MIFHVLFGLAAAASTPAPTDEIFHVGPPKLAGPCYGKIEGKPSESPPASCAAAISAATTAKDKAILYFAWAYSLNEADAALQALPNLDKALALAPNFTNARHERSYTLSDLGFYERALVDSDRDVALSPDRADSYRERAFARHRLADLAGALADRMKVIDLEGANHDNQMGLVEELIWLGRYDEAAKRLAALPESDGDKELRADLDHRRQFKPDGKEADRCALKESVDNRTAAQKMVDDCTWAFDHATDRVKRADYLTTRAVNYVIAFQTRDNMAADLQIAVGLDPKNPDRHTNLGFAFLSARHSWAARNEFDTALAAPGLSPRSKAIALAGRGQARANLGDDAGAFADGKASYEIQPMEPNVTLLGNLLFAKGDKEGAKKLWMAAYHLGGRDDSLMQSLKSVGVEDPEKEPR
ncbi:MAG TPA: hypothetical protein VF079_00340 [Sphingomicrobium sp.]